MFKDVIIYLLAKMELISHRWRLRLDHESCGSSTLTRAQIEEAFGHLARNGTRPPVINRGDWERERAAYRRLFRDRLN